MLPSPALAAWAPARAGPPSAWLGTGRPRPAGLGRASGDHRAGRAPGRAPARPRPRRAVARRASWTVPGEAPPRQAADRHDWLYGVFPVLYALRAKHRRFLRLYTSHAPGGDRRRGPVQPKDETVRNRAEIFELAERCRLQISEVGRRQLDELSEMRPHQGFVLKCLPRPLKPLFEMLPSPAPNSLWVALESITDPINLGSALRSSAFYGVGGVLLPRTSAARMNAVASKTSAGAGEFLPLHSAGDVAEMIAGAQALGWRVLGGGGEGPKLVSLDEAAETVRADREAGRLQGVILVLGAEGPGLTPEAQDACDALVRIEGGHASGLDSLNVGVATGIMLHALRGALGPSPETGALGRDDAPRRREADGRRGRAGRGRLGHASAGR